MSQEWSRDSKISFSSLLVSLFGILLAVLGVVVSIFAPQIHDWMGLPGNLALLLYAFAAGLGIPGAFIGLVFAVRLPKQSQKILMLTSLMVIVLTNGLLLGGAWYRARQAAPLVLVGSSNVMGGLATITNRLPLEKMKPTWLDIPSEYGLDVVFHAFEYGENSSRGNNRVALLALSSYGTHELEKKLKEATPGERKKISG